MDWIEFIFDYDLKHKYIFDKKLLKKVTANGRFLIGFELFLAIKFTFFNLL